MIAPAGNNAQQVATFPAAWPGAFGVGATSDAETRSAFSNFGMTCSKWVPRAKDW